MRIKIPRRKNMTVTNPEDPLIFYYKFGVRNFYLKRLKMVLKLLDKNGFNKILEVGCGSGILLPELSKRCESLYGVDTHNELDKVKMMLQNEGIEADLSKGDVLDLPFKEEMFDCVVCVSVLEHIKNLDKAINEIQRVMSKNSIAIVGFPVKNKITDMAFKSIGFAFKSKHVSNHSQILEKLNAKMTIQKLIKFPSFFPIDLSFYIASKLTKKRK